MGIERFSATTRMIPQDRELRLTIVRNLRVACSAIIGIRLKLLAVSYIETDDDPFPNLAIHTIPSEF